MNIFLTLDQLSRKRGSWSLLFLLTLVIEICALFFQHVQDLQPCVMCIYERVAMFGILAAALIGLTKPDNVILRTLAMISWGYASYRGLALSNQHVDFQFNPSPFATCDVFVSFPDWAPLNTWLPSVFEAYGDCSEVVWQFFGLSMPQWLVIIFSLNILACAIIFLAQLIARMLPKQ